MHKLYDLKEMLLEELEQFADKPMNGSTLQTIDILAHAIKNLCKIIESSEEMENRSYYRRGDSYYRRGEASYEGDSSYDDGGSSYARGRGRNARRDSRGRYASNNYYNAKDEVTEKLDKLMQDAPDDASRQEIQRVMQKLEQM